MRCTRSMNASRSSPRRQRRQPGGERDDLDARRRPACIGGICDPRGRAHVARRRARRSTEYHGTASPFASIVDAAVAVVAGERDERRAVADVARSSCLVLLGAATHGIAEPVSAGRVLDALDQEAVAVADVRELVDEAGLRRAPPRLAGPRRRSRATRDARVQAQVVAGRRAADAASAAAAPGDSSAPHATTTLRRAHRHLAERGAVVVDVDAPRRRRRGRSRPAPAARACARRTRRRARTRRAARSSVADCFAPGLVAEAEVAGAVRASTCRGPRCG